MMTIVQNKLAVVSSILLLLVVPALASDNLSPQAKLAIAKIAGACGILDSMIRFQKTTRMQGGDEFVARFWAVEATRLGLSVKGLSDQCDQSIATYDKLWRSAESPK